MNRSKWLVGVLAVLLLFIIGCSKDDDKADAKKDGKESEEKKEEENTSEQLGDYQIVFQGNIEEEDDVFVIEVESNLLPGARVIGENIVDDGETIFSDTSELVGEDGTFQMELDHHQYGDAEIRIRFDFEGMQEDEIKRHYGEKGQKLEGPFVYKEADNFQKAEIMIPYQSDGDNELAIVAPEWGELPDDYGDPRIWIETDEVTEDGEFIYITGKSNILEGAFIEAIYKNNRGKTHINPDGTFSMKLDYEYLEDQELLVTFRPADYSQWNEIHEAYGQEGQKLVGNLVKKEDFSDKQYIRKVVEWDDESTSSNPDDDVDEEDQSDDEKMDDDKDEA